MSNYVNDLLVCEPFSRLFFSFLFVFVAFLILFNFTSNRLASFNAKVKAISHAHFLNSSYDFAVILLRLSLILFTLFSSAQHFCYLNYL